MWRVAGYGKEQWIIRYPIVNIQYPISNFQCPIFNVPRTLAFTDRSLLKSDCWNIPCIATRVVKTLKAKRGISRDPINGFLKNNAYHLLWWCDHHHGTARAGVSIASMGKAVACPHQWNMIRYRCFHPRWFHSPKPQLRAILNERYLLFFEPSYLINAAPGGNKYRNKSSSNRACTVSSLHATRDCNFRFIMRCSLLLWCDVNSFMSNINRWSRVKVQ